MTMNSQPSPAAVIARLTGKPMWRPSRAVDMQMFDFGERVPYVDRRGRDRLKGEYGLHIQSRWRLVREGAPTISYEDLLRSTVEEPDAPFDPDLGSRTLRDELLERFVSDSSDQERTVDLATVTDAGGLHLRFQGGATLDVDAADPGSQREAWRLLLPDGSHAVMSGSGFAVEGPSAS